MADIAREAGVSRALVSIAYRGVPGVSDSTRARIFAVGERLQYSPDLNAARLAQSAGRTLGVYLQDLHNDVFADMFDGVRGETDAAGKDLVLAVGSIDGTRDPQALATLESGRVDVIIAAGLQLPDAQASGIAARVPLVSIARDIPGADAAISDNHAGAGLATDHLLSLGHSRIVFLANPQTDGYRDRRRGYEHTMMANGLTALVVPTTYARADAAATARTLLTAADAPTAIFAHNDQAALGVLDAMATLGLRAGIDVSVIGYDNSSVSRAPGTALTTVDIHAQQLGAAAARLAMARITNPDAPPQVDSRMPTVVVRATTGPAPR